MQATLRTSTVRGHTPKRLQGSKVVVGLEQLQKDSGHAIKQKKDTHAEADQET